MENDVRVFVVDDDVALRRSLEVQLASAGFQVEAYASAEDFLQAGAAERAGCLILDLHMPGLSGQELLEHLKPVETDISVLVLTGYGDVPSAVQAMQMGALDFLEKPIGDDDLLRKVTELAETTRQKHEKKLGVSKVAERMLRLTPREREVMELVVAGQRSKAIAEQLGVSRRTVEAHRARVMEKMQAKNIAELLRMTLSVTQP